MAGDHVEDKKREKNRDQINIIEQRYLFEQFGFPEVDAAITENGSNPNKNGKLNPAQPRGETSRMHRHPNTAEKKARGETQSQKVTLQQTRCETVVKLRLTSWLLSLLLTPRQSRPKYRFDTRKEPRAQGRVCREPTTE